MVKLDLVTLRAPVTWIGPAGYGEGGWAGLVFLNLALVLLGGVMGFLEVLGVFEVLGSRLDFLLLGETFEIFGGGEDDFFLFFGFTGVIEAGVSGSGGTSFSFASFSRGISSFCGAGDKKNRRPHLMSYVMWLKIMHGTLNGTYRIFIFHSITFIHRKGAYAHTEIPNQGKIKLKT